MFIVGSDEAFRPLRPPNKQRGSGEHKIYHLYEEHDLGVLKSQNVLGYIGGCIFMSRLNLQSMQ